MALHYDLTKVPNFDTLDHVTNGCIIHLTMLIGMGELSENTVDEFWHRADVFQTVHGPMMKGSQGPVWLTEVDIQRRIGLRTNVFPKETNRKFMSRMAKAALERLLKEHKERVG